jgi:hypothetical protein
MKRRARGPGTGIDQRNAVGSPTAQGYARPEESMEATA